MDRAAASDGNVTDDVIPRRGVAAAPAGGVNVADAEDVHGRVGRLPDPLRLAQARTEDLQLFVDLTDHAHGGEVAAADRGVHVIKRLEIELLGNAVQLNILDREAGHFRLQRLAALGNVLLTVL